LELLKTPQLKRLKGVHQQGIYYYAWPEYHGNRFEHSVGVMLVLKKFGASLAEQVSGLLHDVSHGVFSHVLDYLYNKSEAQDYQDLRHHRAFDEQIVNILENHHLKIEEIVKVDQWPLLEKPLPDICADRLDYTLRDACLVKKIDKNFVTRVLDNLKIINQQFVFKDFSMALDFANLSWWMCRFIWHSEWGEAIFQLMSQVLKRALELKLINEADLFGTDDLLISKLRQSQNQATNDLLDKVKNFKKEQASINKKDYDFFSVTKMRVIDPLVKTKSFLKRVSELDNDFKNKFNQEKVRVREMYLKILK